MGVGVIGASSTSNNIVTILGPGSSWTGATSLTVGGGGKGTLVIESGGTVVNSSSSTIGNLLGSVGEAFVTGSNSTWNAGTFFNLLDMIDGAQDGDALFFSRNLKVTGDTEAVVALRNALDDFEGSALDSVVGSFGPLAKPAALMVSGLRALQPGPRHV